MKEMKARDIMNREVLTINPHTSVKEADELLKKHKVTGLPVVDKKGEIVGIVSEKHLLSIYDVKGGEVDEYAFRLPHEYRTWVEEIMTREVISVDEETPLREICELIVKKHVHRVPVLREKKVVGIISTMDITRYLLELLNDDQSPRSKVQGQHQT